MSKRVSNAIVRTEKTENAFLASGDDGLDIEDQGFIADAGTTGAVGTGTVFIPVAIGAPPPIVGPPGKMSPVGEAVGGSGIAGAVALPPISVPVMPISPPVIPMSVR
jgi:hypothetical protein